MMLAGLNPAASGQVYNIGSLFLTWKEIGDIIISLTNSTSVIRLMSTDQWQGPAFLNEVWDLDWSKARQALGFEPGCSTETMKSLFIEALKTCVIQVKKEEEKP
jgi:nucleoside-diphosphate-sugar epimerase